MHRLERRWYSPFDGGEWHGYDPLPPAEFLRGLRVAAELTEGRRLLDVGCGAGRNLALAYALGFSVGGIERHLPLAEAARELLPEATILYANALDVHEFDCDVLYMYRPAKADELEEQLEQHVRERVNPGTVMFWPLRGGVWRT